MQLNLRPKYLLLTIATGLVMGCAGTANEPVHVAYGKVLAVHQRLAVTQQPNLAGAAVGGLAGGAIGNQFGQGDGKTAMTVLGALAGAAAGSQVNKNETVQAVTDLKIQPQDGPAFTITTADVGFRVGQNVKITQQGRKAVVERTTD